MPDKIFQYFLLELKKLKFLATQGPLYTFAVINQILICNHCNTLSTGNLKNKCEWVEKIVSGQSCNNVYIPSFPQAAQQNYNQQLMDLPTLVSSNRIALSL